MQPIKLRKVPVITIDHLRAFSQFEKGELPDDERSQRLLTDLFRMGWVTTSAVRH